MASWESKLGFLTEGLALLNQVSHRQNMFIPSHCLFTMHQRVVNNMLSSSVVTYAACLVRFPHTICGCQSMQTTCTHPLALNLLLVCFSSCAGASRFHYATTTLALIFYHPHTTQHLDSLSLSLLTDPAQVGVPSAHLCARRAATAAGALQECGRRVPQHHGPDRGGCLNAAVKSSSQDCEGVIASLCMTILNEQLAPWFHQ